MDNKMGTWIAVGIVLGAGVGSARGNIPVGIGVGLILGVVGGLVSSEQEDNNKKAYAFFYLTNDTVTSIIVS